MDEIRYSVIRSARRSFSVTVKGDNSVVVRCPLRATERQIVDFVGEKSRWIVNSVRKNEAKLDRFSEIISLRKVLVKGKAVPVTFGGVDYIGSDFASFRDRRHIKSTLVSALGGEFSQVYEEVVRLTSLSAKSISFREYKARWGCCDARGNIVFNYKLLMLDERFWRYVILHELCHTVYMNHSAKFYSLMESYMPDFRRIRAELKEYSPVAAL